MEKWNKSIQNIAGAHILQTAEWADNKRMNGWSPTKKIWTDDQSHFEAASIILQRSIPLMGFAARSRILYIPRGPMMDWENVSLRERVISDLNNTAVNRGPFSSKWTLK